MSNHTDTMAAAAADAVTAPLDLLLTDAALGALRRDGNPLLRRVLQAYLAATRAAEGLVAGADLRGGRS